MQFLYHPNSGDEILILEQKEFHYLFKVKRAKNTNILNCRNMKDGTIYTYKLIEKNDKNAKYKLKTSKKQDKKRKGIHLGISIIDPKEIEKNLASLNELEVSKISFIYAQNSQQNFKLNLERLNKILINSSQQCGRRDLLQIEIVKNIKTFLKTYPESFLLNFNEKKLNSNMDINTIVIGAEGGFSDDELKLFDDNKKVGLNINSILKSSTACMAVACLYWH